MFGMCGAMKESKCLLSMYLLVVFVALCLQMFVATVLYRFNDTVADQMTSKTGISATDISGYRGQFIRHIGNATVNIYGQGKCTNTNNSDTTLKIKCDGSNTAWFQNFVNTKCVANDGSWNSTILAQCEEMDKVNPAPAVAAWCKCTQAITAEIHTYAKPLTNVAFAAAGIEFVLLLASSYMVCCYNKRQAEAQKSDQELAKAQADEQGINMV